MTDMTPDPREGQLLNPVAGAAGPSAGAGAVPEGSGGYPAGGPMWGGYGPPPTSYPPPDAPVQSRRRRRTAWLISGGALVVAASMCAGGVIGAAVASGSTPTSSTATSGGTAASGQLPGGSSTGTGSGFGSRFGYGGPGFGTGGGPTSGTGSTSTAGTASATAAQEAGVVDVDTVLGYQNAEAAGTGMILTSAGEVLTNNHVVDGATSIKVTVVSTGATYPATVVGTDPTQDVAVLQLQGASGLQTVKTASAAVGVGTSVTGVGNAGGVGGTPSAAAGTVTATDQTITASDQGGANAETLHGLIQTDAAIQAGDSGGPLLNSNDQVVGMDTAASATAAVSTAAGYAIPIGTALQAAQQIEAGHASSTVHLGYPAFLGVSLQTSDLSGSSATVQAVVPSSAAADAGITAGDVITAVGGHTVTSASTLQAALAGYRPGERTVISWTDATGQSHTATVTLSQGPAD